MSDVVSWNGQPLSYWLDALGAADGEKRWQAVDALRHIADPMETVPLFIAALQHDSFWRTRALAAHALYDMAFDAELRPLLHPVALQIAGALKDESPHVRLNAAFALETLGPGAKEAIPALREAADNGDDELRRAANAALVGIAGGEPDGKKW
jgi:HEAT repeat protein